MMTGYATVMTWNEETFAQSEQWRPTTNNEGRKKLLQKRIDGWMDR